MPKSKSLRLFVAIDAPEPTRAALAGLATKSLNGISWTPAHQLHLTLRFIGNVTDEQCARIEQALARIRVEPFVLNIEGLGTFPSKHSPRIIWAGVGNAHPRLLQLRQGVDNALRDCGIGPETRPFHPHFTLGRVGKGGSRIEIAQFIRRHSGFAAEPFQVSTVILYKSDLNSIGAIHTPLLVVDLAAG